MKYITLGFRDKNDLVCFLTEEQDRLKTISSIMQYDYMKRLKQ